MAIMRSDATTPNTITNAGESEFELGFDWRLGLMSEFLLRLLPV